MDLVLLEKLAHHIEADPSKVSTIFYKDATKLIYIFSLASFKPFNWSSTIYPALKDSQLFQKQHEKDINWFDTTLKLISLHEYDDFLIKKIFDGQYLKESTRTTRNVLLSFLRIYQCVALHKLRNDDMEFSVSPNIRGVLTQALRINLDINRKFKLDPLIPKIFEKSYFTPSVYTRYGNYIQYLFKYNKSRRDYAEFSKTSADGEITLLENISKNADEEL